MKVTIIPDDKYVSVDGVGYFDLTFSIDPSISAIQWYDTEGEIEFKEVNRHKPQNSYINSFDSINDIYQVWLSKHNEAISPKELTEDELKLQCKETAKYLLYKSDWAVLPDVNLVNKSEFESYRAILRNLVISPIANPTYPTEPQPQWS